MYLPLIAIFVAISGGLSVSYMAENSFPGNPLYPIKIRVNNNFKQTTTELPLEEPSLGSSSYSIYLRAFANANESTTLENAAPVSSEATLHASTSLNSDQVINGE